jgi:hypothetical protein
MQRNGGFGESCPLEKNLFFAPFPLFPSHVTLGKSKLESRLRKQKKVQDSDPQKEPHVKVTMLPDYLLEEEDFAARAAGRLAISPRAEDEDDLEEEELEDDDDDDLDVDDDEDEDEDEDDEDDEDFDDDWEEVDDDDDLEDDDLDDEDDEDDLDDDDDDDWDDDEEEEEEEEAE